MKQRRFRFKILALILLGMFALLAVYGGYSVNTYGNRWFSFSRNPRIRTQKQNVDAGDILDRNGVVLAWSEEGKRYYQEDDSARRAVVHLLGDSQGQVSNGVEAFQTSYLYGFNLTLGERLAALGSSEPLTGDTVTLTIDSRLCTAIPTYFNAHAETAGKKGAVVVMNYKTGEVLAEISLPNFDPMNITADTLADPGQPFWNRATQSVYPPGSSFKIITTVASLKYLPGIENTPITCGGGLMVDNQAIRDYGSAIHGELSLKKAFTTSCNNAYARLALAMEDAELRRTAEDFGFNDNFLFRDLVVENSTYPTKNRSQFEIATSGFGQSAITASPVHMCMVAAAIANDGQMMEPRLLRRVDGATGVERTVFESRLYRTATTPEIAATLQGYMQAVATSGTGTRAAVPGLTIGGKTGSAESSLDGADVTYGWFVGYIADDSLPFALSVLVEDIPDGEGGGSTAARIAGDIFRYLKEHPELVTDNTVE